MCGIVGYNVGPRAAGDQADWRNQIVLDLLEASIVRGRDATGIACVTPEGAPRILKDAVSSLQFARRLDVRRDLNRDAHTTVLGHVRAATVGDAGRWENAHPFRVGSVIGVHNGNIPNAKAMASWFGGFAPDGETDSEAAMISIATAFEDQPMSASDLARFLDLLSGEWALGLADVRKPESVFLATNGGRPLAVAQVIDTVFFASTAEILRSVLGRKVPVRMLRPGAVFEYQNGKVVGPQSILLDRTLVFPLGTPFLFWWKCDKTQRCCLGVEQT